MNDFNEINELNIFNSFSPSNNNISYYNYQSPMSVPDLIDHNNNSINNSNYDGFQNENQQQDFNINQYESIPQTPTMPFVNNENIMSDEPFKNNKTQSDTKNIEIIETNFNSKNNFLEAPELVCSIENIVSTANLKCKLNLREIALQLANSTYNPRRFSGLIIRLKNPKITALLFSNGKIVCLGAKKEQISLDACRKVEKMIKNLGHKVTFSEFTIQNIVGSADLKMKISLIKLLKHLNEYTKGKQIAYEPELFPGLIYHLVEPKMAFLIFASGKIVLAGGKKIEDINKGFEDICSLLAKFKRNEPLLTSGSEKS